MAKSFKNEVQVNNSHNQMPSNLKTKINLNLLEENRNKNSKDFGIQKRPDQVSSPKIQYILALITISNWGMNKREGFT